MVSLSLARFVLARAFVVCLLVSLGSCSRVVVASAAYCPCCWLCRSARASLALFVGFVAALLLRASLFLVRLGLSLAAVRVCGCVSLRRVLVAASPAAPYLPSGL